MPRLSGKVAIITGAARGQGAATARLFADEGATVVLTDKLAEPVRETAASIKGGVAYSHDVSDESDWERVVSDVERKLGGIDILINNAAIVRAGPLLTSDQDQLLTLLKINVVGCWLGVRAVVPAMRRRGQGSIVNISSTSGLRGNAYMSSYDASKWAVRGMSKSLALEFAQDNIRVNSIHPGAIDTPMLNVEPDQQEHLAERMRLPFLRIGKPIEVAHASLFLASDEASYISGAELAVDGAWTAGILPTREERYDR